MNEDDIEENLLSDTGKGGSRDSDDIVTDPSSVGNTNLNISVTDSNNEKFFYLN